MVESMRSWRASSNARLFTAIALGMLLVGACKTKEAGNTIADTAAPAVTGGATATDTTKGFYPEEFPDSTRTLLAKSSWVDTNRWNGRLDCGDGSACGGQTSVAFRMRAMSNAHDIKHDQVVQGLDPAAYIAELTNLDGVPYGPWNMIAKDVAYLYIGLLKDGTRRIAIVRVPSTGSATTLVTAQREAKCDVDQPPSGPSVNMKQPWHCKGAPKMTLIYGPPYPLATEVKTGTSNAASGMLASSPLGRAGILSSLAPPPGYAISGLWISCSGGCCEASSFR